jgi:hypothetical protein
VGLTDGPDLRQPIGRKEDTMQAPETIEIVEATETRVRGACLIGGCTCKDSRIVSYRRAAFFAAMALRSGQTADRIVAGEPDWRIPSAPLTDLEPPVPGEGSKDQDQPSEISHTFASA